jgi:hypothetical protein
MPTATATSGLRVWFRDEIEHTIEAVDLANRDIARHINTPEMTMYRMGYEAAIEAFATAFGIRYVRPNQSSLIPGRTNSGAPQ